MREQLLQEIEGAPESLIADLLEVAKLLKSKSTLSASASRTIEERRAILAKMGRYDLPILSDEAMSRSTIYD